MKNKILKNKVARELTYKTVTGILPILKRFSASLGITDVHLLCDTIINMSVDEFCDFKFDQDVIEGDYE